MSIRITGISGSCCVARCSDTADCAPKLDDSACWPDGVAQRPGDALFGAALRQPMVEFGQRAGGFGGGQRIGRSHVSASVGTVRWSRFDGACSMGMARRTSRSGIATTPRAHQEIAEAFVLRAFAGVVGEQRVERGEDVRFGDVLAIQRVEALAAVVGAEHQVVAAGRLADERDLAQVRPRAAVRAAADAQVDRRVGEAVAGEQGFDLGDQVRQIAFGFGHRQAAGRQRHAGERVASQRTRGAIAVEAEFGDQGVDARAQLRRDAGDDQVLVRRHAELGAIVPSCSTSRRATSRRPLRCRTASPRPSSAPSTMRPAGMRSVRCAAAVLAFDSSRNGRRCARKRTVAPAGGRIRRAVQSRA